MPYADQRTSENRRHLERQPVAERATELVRAVAALNEEIAVWVRTEEQNRKLVHALGERVKELTALHGVAQLLTDRTKTVSSLLQEIVSTLPPAWQYPELAAARIRFDGIEYTSAGFASSPWKQTAEVALADGRMLVIEVFYLVEQPTEWEGPFLAEERRLINSLAQMLKSALDRRQAEEALKDSEGRIRDMAGRLILAQEEERMRIARDLHDDVLQQLGGLEIEIGALRKQLGTNPAALESLSGLQVRARQVSNVIRHITHELHPSMLTFANLFVALRSHCEEFEKSTGIRLALKTEGAPEHLPQQVSLNLYRIIQEALHNIAKHSGSPEASITVVIDAAECQLRISDRGRGFVLKEALKGGGLGLNSIEERTHLMKGTLCIESEPLKGTAVLVRTPIGINSVEQYRSISEL